MVEAPREQIRVLHVDDEPTFADVTATSLEREHDQFEVHTVTSPAEGLEELAASTVDCVVSDYDMPRTNGIEFLEQLREDHPDLPFILFTGKGSETVASDAISAGVTDYIQKSSGTHQFELLANRIERAVDQYRAEQKLERQSDLFGKAQHAADIGAWAYDVESDTLRWTEKVYDIHGVSTEFEPTIDSIQELYHPEDRQKALNAIAQARTNAEPYDLEIRMTGGDELTWVRTVADPQTEDGEVVRIRGIVHDITERKKREQELEQYEYFFEYSPDLIVLLDEEFTIQYQSPASSLHDMDPIRIVGEDPLEYIHPEDHPTVYEHFAELEANPKEPISAEFRIRDVSGEWRWVETRGINLLGEEPVDGFLGMLRDITEQKRKRLELERQNERLAEFTSIVSHDLRNPLEVARLRVELATDECGSSHLADALDALDQSEALIEDLLTLAREGGTVDETAAVDPENLLEDIWETVRTEESTLEVATDRPIQANRSRLRQLLQNLLANAVEHAGEDVSVTVGELDDGFYVEDDGPGIPEDRRPKVFEAGYSTAQGGTGFGLRIVERMADAHDWTVTVTEGTAGGARFEFRGVGE